MIMEEKEIQKKATINVWGIAFIDCRMDNPTFQTLVVDDGQRMSDATEATEVYEYVDLVFFTDKRFGTLEKQSKMRRVLMRVLPRMDVGSGRDWVAVYIAYHYYIERIVMMKGQTDFFKDIDALLPGVLTKVNARETGDKRYKSYTDLLRLECANWFIIGDCLPPMQEWTSKRFRYKVDDTRRERIQQLVRDIFQGWKNEGL